MFWRVVRWPLPPAELVGDAGELVDLVGGGRPLGNLAAHHLNALLALPVDAVFQAEGAEIVFRDLPRQVGQCLDPESLDLLPDHVFMLILKLFPLSKGFRCGCCHRSTYRRMECNHPYIYRD